MDRKVFVNSFAKRLNFLLQKKGYSSDRSKAGVRISDLARIAGVSYQMARKYALGLALPEFNIIPKIAKWLNVSSSWLLFGERDPVTPHSGSSSMIEIESELLKYILCKCAVLFPPSLETERIIDYIVGVIYDASHLSTDNKTIIKIVDMMTSSAFQLTNITKEKRV